MRAQSITLNFLPITSSFEVTCYERKLNVPNEQRPFPEAYLYVRPKSDGSDLRSWLSMTYHDGYVPCRIMSDARPNVATWALRQYVAPLLASHLNAKECRAEIRRGLFSTIDVRVKEFKEGWQGFKCEFTWIPSLRQHGLLVRYHFFRNPDCNNIIALQKFSLSLNQYGSPNKDFYADVRGLLESFKTKFLADFRFAMSHSGAKWRREILGRGLMNLDRIKVGRNHILAFVPLARIVRSKRCLHLYLCLGNRIASLQGSCILV